REPRLEAAGHRGRVVDATVVHDDVSGRAGEYLGGGAGEEPLEGLGRGVGGGRGGGTAPGGGWRPRRPPGAGGGARGKHHRRPPPCSVRWSRRGQTSAPSRGAFEPW